MCGLSGVAGSISSLEEEVASDLLFMNNLRGDDSTGVSVVNRDKDHTMNVCKAMGPSWYLTDMKKYEKMMGGSHDVIMQHNRKATIGGTTLQFAHPFLFNHIMGCHNGTVALMDVKNLPGQKEAVSDSYAIIESINDNGIIETCKHLEEWGQNAWALVWYDKRDHSINFLRNKNRPLFYSYNESHDSVFWSSEVEMLASAITRNGVKRKVGEKSFWVPIDTHLKFIIPSFNKEFETPTQTKVEYRKMISYSYGGSGNRPFPSTRIKETQQNKKSLIITRDNMESSLPPWKVIQENTVKGLPRDKFYLCYRDDSQRIYYDTNDGKYTRYWWDQYNTQYHPYVVDGIPPELDNADIIKLITEKRCVINKPLSVGGKPPTSDPPIKESKEYVRFKGARMVVTKSKDKKDLKPWGLYEWNSREFIWTHVVGKTVSYKLPDTMLDINSNHRFKSKGKREKKKIYYKGFNGSRLLREDFNLLTKEGCFGCGRTPTWVDGRMGGVLVNFFSPTQFLCEYCNEEEGLLSDLMKHNGTIKSENKVENNEHVVH